MQRFKRKTTVTIGEENGRGYLTAHPRWDFSTLEVARGAPGRTRFLNNRLWFELTEDNRLYMATHFGAKPAGDHSLGEGVAAEERPPFATKLPPTDLQIEARDHAGRKRKFAFFEKPGSGKTKLILDHLVRLWCANIIDAALVIAPNFVHEQWIVDEVPKHIHPTIPIDTCFWTPGRKLRNPKIVEPNPSALRIFTVGFESYTSAKFEPIRDAFISSGRTACVIDESHRIKTPSSKISRALNNTTERYHARFVASGEPIPLGLQDYYAQIRFLDPRILGTFTFAGFKSRYCIMGGFMDRSVVGYVNEGELHDRMAPHVHVGEPRIEAEQVFHAPWRFDLHPTTREAYEQMRQNLLVELEDGRLSTAASQLAAIVRLQQIAAGRLVLEDGEVEMLPNRRFDVLREVVKGIDGKIIIWNEFLADIEQQQEWLKDGAVVIAGPVSRDDRVANKEQFLAPGGPRFLLATPGAAGTGVDGLQRICNHAIYYTQKDNAGLRWQSEKRIFRLGVEKDAHYHDIVARATVDVAVQQRNRRKRNTAAMSYAEFRSILEAKYD